MRDGVVGVVQVEGRSFETVQPQEPGAIRLTRPVVACGGYIHTPWMLMQFRMIHGFSPSVTTIDALGRALRHGKAEHAHLRALASDADRRAFSRESVPDVVRL